MVLGLTLGAEALGDGTLVIDVRTPEEWSRGHLLSARRVDWQDIGNVIGTLTNSVDHRIVLYCRSGSRSGKAKDILHSAVGRGPISGITSGTVVTVLVQSSSTTTSLVVPLAGSGVFSLRQVYPFTLGANIGTCITALLAATAIVGPSAVFALQIALVHLLYNVLGVLVIYSIPFLRELPIKGAEKIADVAVRNKLVALGYIAGMFFVIPFVMIGISNLIAA